ncbi:hypothetical protein AAG570_003192 [Ranatra chinensis]|uniref:Uncharacterized protein n=1 Tax=Ranatra chinensis TaxID=642074 RepID=A0ABD0Y624_9HEMI
MASNRRNMFYQNKKQETTEIGSVRSFGTRVLACGLRFFFPHLIFEVNERGSIMAAPPPGRQRHYIGRSLAEIASLLAIGHPNISFKARPSIRHYSDGQRGWPSPQVIAVTLPMFLARLHNNTIIYNSSTLVLFMVCCENSPLCFCTWDDMHRGLKKKKKY